jgi:voltage-gated potassium channel
VEEKAKIKMERWRLLASIKKIMDGPMIFLGFVWLILIIVDFLKGLPSVLQKISNIIWIIFIIDFIIALILAPDKKIYLKKNILTIISLAIPAFRIFGLIRFISVLRGARLVRMLASVNRSMGGLAKAMSRRAFGYVSLLTFIVVIASSAGMYYFEKNAQNGPQTFFESLWYTFMIMLTIGSDYWPRSPEGRILCCLISLYGFAILGYLTATLASFFLGRDAALEGTRANEIHLLKKEIEELKELIKKNLNKESR